MDVDPLPISALQHLLFCERQCALIHIEGLWAENRLTVEGKHPHEKAHSGKGESRPGVRIARGLALCSERLGLWGYADVVEFHSSSEACRVVPVEYKRGRPKGHDADRVQLCAQAICLEEMLETQVESGALYYGRTRRREEVLIDAAIRAQTEGAASRLHALVGAGLSPRARREPKCDHCSLKDMCLPEAVGRAQSASRYLARAIGSAIGGGQQGEGL